MRRHLPTSVTLVAALRGAGTDFELVEVPDADVPLADAIRSYLFNAQLVTTPDGAVTLIVPQRGARDAAVRAWIERHWRRTARSGGSKYVDVRQSMANGGGPACLRLRVACDPATVDPRFLVDEAKLERIGATIAAHWPEEIAAGDLQHPALVATIEHARDRLARNTCPR